MRIGILGGTFNPIHFGHLRAAEEVRESLRLDKVIFIPSGMPPLKDSDIASQDLRLKMTSLAVSANPYFEVSDIEVRRSGRSYTVETIAELMGIYPKDEMIFILGIDAFLDLPHWKSPKRLVSLTDFAIISRPGLSFESLRGAEFLDTEKDALSALDNKETGLYEAFLEGGRKAYLINITPFYISATDIRRRIRGGLSIKYMLPETVESFIILNGIYKRPEDQG